MLTKLEALVGSKIGLFVLWALSLVLVYHFSQSVEKDKRNAVDSAVTSIATQASKQLATSINAQVAGINSRLTGDKHATDFILTGQIATLQNAADSLAKLPHAGVWVKGSLDTAATHPATGAADRGTGNHATYRAELSDEAKGFFAGEAKRADTCAVRLTGAQSTIVSWQRAVADYNAMLAIQYPNVPKVKLQ